MLCLSAIAALLAADVSPHEALTTAVLQRATKIPDYLPDAAMLKLPHRVLGEVIDSPYTITKPPAGWKLASWDSLQAEADRTGTSIAFAFIRGLEIRGDVAELTVGVDLALPRLEKGLKVCCCSASETWVRVNKRWVFSKRAAQICS